MRYQFAEFEINAQTLEFRVNGVQEKLEPQVFDLLVLLAKNPDRLITRDELIDEIWQGRIVSEATISSRINAARKALNDDGTRQRWIKTIPRRGIRFTGQVIRLADDPSTGSGPVRSDITCNDKPSLVVLPFQNLSNDPENALLSEGLSEDIITALSQIEAIFVIARGTAFRYGDGVTDYKNLTDELGVRYVLEGSLRTHSGQVRVAARLIDTSNGQHIWAERFDRAADNVFELEDEISSEIVSQLQVQLTEGEMLRIRKRQTTNLPAWKAMMRGMQYLRHFTREDVVEARRLFAEACAHDPDFSAAYSMLGWTHLVDARLAYTASVEKSLDAGVEVTKKALDLNPEDPDGNSILGGLLVLQRRYDEAEEAARRGIAFGPGVADSHVWLGFVLVYRGKAEEALVSLNRAQRLSPVYPDWYDSIIGLCHLQLGHYEDALKADEKRLAINPDNPFSNFRMAVVLMKMRRPDEAKERVKAALAANAQTSLKQVRASEPFEDEEELNEFLGLLRLAGLPEE